MKLRRKLLSLLMTMSFLIALILPTATPALAFGEYKVFSAPRVSDNDVCVLGTVFLFVIAGSLSDGDIVSLRLPSGLVWSKVGMKDTPMTKSDWERDGNDMYSAVYGQKGTLSNPGQLHLNSTNLLRRR